MQINNANINSKKLINNHVDDKFCSLFKERLTKIFKESESSSIIDPIMYRAGSSGWASAFNYACENTGKNYLIAYCGKLGWREYDKFNEILSHRLLKDEDMEAWWEHDDCYKDISIKEDWLSDREKILQE